MPQRDALEKLKEVEHGLGLLAAEVEAQLDTRPINLLHWQRRVREAIAQLEEGGWGSAVAPRPADDGGSG